MLTVSTKLCTTGDKGSGILEGYRWEHELSGRRLSAEQGQCALGGRGGVQSAVAAQLR